MKLKKIEISIRRLNFRLIRSLLWGALFFILVILAFRWIKYGELRDEAPVTIRAAHEWNEKIWKQFQSQRLSVKKPVPPKGKNPRVNGSLGLESPVDLKNYVIQVASGSQEMKLPISAFYLLPKVHYSTDFRCIEGWSEETQYAGARFLDFMKNYNLGKKADGTYFSYVGLETPDGKYYVSIDMESMLHPQTVLAYEMNQAPLSLENGAPLRLLIPIKYGIKSLKRIGKIFFSDVRPPDYWAEQGYDWYSGL